VLVLGPGEEVSSIDISPVHLLGQEINGESFPGAGSLLDRAVSEACLSDTAATLLFEEILIFVSWLELWLGHFVNSLVIEGVVSFCISGLMLYTLSPGIFGDSP